MSLGCQHGRRSFTVPARTGDANLENLRAQCAEKGHIPSGPPKLRACQRCGEPIRPPSLEEVSRLMAEAQR